MADSENKKLLDRLVDETGHTSSSRRQFRDSCPKVGAVYTMFYDRAVVAIFDYDREQAGGLPKGGFLIAAKKEGDESFVLLRIIKEAKLPNASVTDQTRQQGIESSANKGPWPEELDHWMKTQMSLHAIECRLLGTFIEQENQTYKYAEDTDNYFAVNELMVWKPCAETLKLIVNHQHRENAIPMAAALGKIGQTRFAAAEKENATKTDVLLNPIDMLKRRTVYFGMSRSGKSNAMKITAERIYRLREENPENRVGQLIFDPNGEYAQDNLQDGKGLHKIHEVLGLPREGEVETYGLFPVQSDPDRIIMKINFFGDPLPPISQWTTISVETALDQLLAGREIVCEIMSGVSTNYMKAFRDVDLSVPLAAEGDVGLKIRYRRAILAYQTALAAAGFTPPSWKPSINGLFTDKLITSMESTGNSGSQHSTNYAEAARMLKKSKQNQGDITWAMLEKVFTALDQFINDSNSAYDEFERKYIDNSESGEKWADSLLQNLLRIFAYKNGPRSFQIGREQHNPKSSNDFAQNVVVDLQAGKLVIIDQSTGDPEQNRKAAERIMWRVFRTQQTAFRNAVSDGGLDANQGHILVYLEEAHNLLPRANAAENLRTVWARSAKEGSKMNLGMVLATQAPSSIMPEILSETDNWILAYLNSENERRVIAGYMDFEDFLEQIGSVSEAGFVRIRTLSRAYTVPVQFDRFRIDTDAS